MFLTAGQYDHLAPLTPLPVPTIEEKIERTAEKYGVEAKLAKAVARAESNFNPTAKNPASSASGVYQFLDGTFSRFCIKTYQLTEGLADKNDPDIQIECAVRMIAEGGITHWQPSEHIWKKTE